MATKRQEAFIADVQKRLASHSFGSTEYAAELERIHADRDAGVAADVAEARELDGAQLARMQAQAARFQRQNAAEALVAPIAHPECIPALVPHAIDRIGIEQTDDGEGRVTYRDANGNPTTREALQAELAARRSLARLIKGASAEEKAAHARRVALALGEKPARTNGQGRH
jgi:hypothetical protein